MDAENRENLRRGILAVLDESKSRLGRSLRGIVFMLPRYGIDRVTNDEVLREIDYLAHPAKGLIEVVGKIVSPELQYWRLTPAGRDALAAGNL